MTTSYIPITLIPFETFQHSLTIRMNHELASVLQLEASTDIIINIGKRSIHATVEWMEVGTSTIEMSVSLYKEFSLPSIEIPLLAAFLPATHTLILGPVIAVMTEISEEKAPHFRSVHSFCEELHYVTRERGGFFYVFRSNQFSTQDTVGFYYDQDQWKKAHLLPPDVIYNRIHSRKSERSKAFLHMKEQMENIAIPIFNDRFLSKWEIHEFLREDPLHESFIPETHLLTLDSLHHMYDSYESLFIKPIHGSQGRNIFHVFKENQSLIAKASTGQPSDNFSNFADVDAFYHWFEKHRRQTTYIVQQGIPLLLYKNRHIDFRVLCHKNKQNAWKVTSVVARISNETQFVANLARGGVAMKPHAVLSELFGREVAKELLQSIKDLALKIANTISTKTTGITGELGLDIGLDQVGQPWLIEVNSKPSKTLEEQEVKIRPSTRAIIDYCTLLGFQYKYKELEHTYADLWIHDPPPNE